MFGVSIEWWILYIVMVVITLAGLNIFRKGVNILATELVDVRDNVRELARQEMLAALREIKYAIDDLERTSMIASWKKARIDNMGHRK